jgi:protein-L-isoaspartate O-methyltransferase
MDRSYEIAMKTFQIQSALRLNYGSFFEELPEQRMSVRYLTGKERVLEIGGNIGRNSLIIACLLNRQENLVTLESNLEIADQLKENRDVNQLHFHVETSALSKRRIDSKGMGYTSKRNLTRRIFMGEYNDA